MTTEEKLRQFTESSLSEARAEADQILNTHREAMDKLYQGHSTTKQRQAQLQLSME